MSSNATANNVQTLPAAPKPQTSKEVIAANVQLLIEQLEAGHSEGLTAYLTAMGRFHNYSFGNILEIARQKPNATRVAGLYAWNQLGRKVTKGSEGYPHPCPDDRHPQEEGHRGHQQRPRRSEQTDVGWVPRRLRVRRVADRGCRASPVHRAHEGRRWRVPGNG